MLQKLLTDFNKSVITMHSDTKTDSLTASDTGSLSGEKCHVKNEKTLFVKETRFHHIY